MKSIDELRAAFKREDKENNFSGNSNYYPFWQLEYGQSATIRFLPDKNEDNPLGFLVEKQSHNLEINGETKKVPCLRMYGKDCPICKTSSEFYKENDEDNGKKYWRKRTYIAQALVIDDPITPKDGEESNEGQVRLIPMGYQLYNVIKEAFESGDLDEIPFAYKGGYNFVIKKTEQGKYATYAVGSRFVRKATDLTDDEIELVEEQMVDLSETIPAEPSFEKVNSMLKAALTGEDYDDDDSNDDSDDDSDDDVPWKDDKPKKTRISDEDEKSVDEDEDEDEEEFSEDADEILRRIRGRSK